MPRPPTDPYATPPLRHDKTGGIVRITILAVLLGGVALGWSYFASHQQVATTPAEQQQLAENNATQSYDVAPEATPARAPAPVAAAPAPRRTPVAPTRRSAPRPAPEMSEPAAPPAATAPPLDTGAAPTPLPPSGL